MPAEALESLIEDFLDQSGLYWERDDDRAWYVRVAGENRQGISMVLRLGERTLKVDSYFIRAPERERLAEAYRWILQKNMRQYLRFACDREGGIHLVGQVPLEACNFQELDRLIGCVLEYQDSNFRPMLEIGFPKALAAIREGRPVPED